MRRKRPDQNQAHIFGPVVPQADLQGGQQRLIGTLAQAVLLRGRPDNLGEEDILGVLPTGRVAGLDVLGIHGLETFAAQFVGDGPVDDIPGKPTDQREAVAAAALGDKALGVLQILAETRVVRRLEQGE